ncbi:hypothetical protein ACEPAI_327 [Sanghuangporus weigelae]
MLFSRVVSFFAFILTLGILAVAKPVELDTRANVASVQNVVATLKSKTDQIVPQIKSAAANHQANSATITPLINELVSALNAAHSSLTRGGAIKLKSRQTQDEIATTFAGVVTDITGAVKLIPFGFPGLPGLIVSLDVALAELLTGLDIAVVGLGLTVGSLLQGVGGLLAGLGFGLTLGLLGL